MTHRNDLIPSDAEAIVISSAPVKNYAGIYVGVTGDVVIRTIVGNDVTFKAVPGGTTLPIACRGVVTTGTTATDLVGYIA